MLTTATTFAGNNVKRILIALALVVASIGGFAAFSPKAEAATAVSFCFKQTNGLAYGNSAVRLVAGNGEVLRNGKTNADGCGTFYNTPSGRYLYVQAYVFTGNSSMGWVHFDGWAPNYAKPGTGTANLGTGWVNKYCYQGLYAHCAGH